MTIDTVEYNPFAPDFYTSDPFRVYRRMRDEAPVYHSEQWGWWALSRFEDVRAAALDSDTFRSFEGMDIDDTGTEQKAPGSLPDMDNPRHDQVRKIVQPFFLPRGIGKMEDQIRAVVRGMITEWHERGAVDLAQDLRQLNAWPGVQQGVILDRRRRRRAWIDLDNLAADHAFAGDLHSGIRSQQ